MATNCFGSIYKMKKLINREQIERKDMNEFFINALEKQCPNFEYIVIETFRDTKGWTSQKITAYRK